LAQGGDEAVFTELVFSIAGCCFGDSIGVEDEDISGRELAFTE
jgi:hypothetical protein